MVRQVAFLMWASKGALTHDIIMKLTWRQFQVYLDSFSWLMNEQGEDGKQKNRTNDLRAMVNNPEAKERKQSMLQETKEKVAKMKERHNKGYVPSKNAKTRNLLE